MRGSWWAFKPLSLSDLKVMRPAATENSTLLPPNRAARNQRQGPATAKIRVNASKRGSNRHRTRLLNCSLELSCGRIGRQIGPMTTAARQHLVDRAGTNTRQIKCDFWQRNGQSQCWLVCTTSLRSDAADSSRALQGGNPSPHCCALNAWRNDSWQAPDSSEVASVRCSAQTQRQTQKSQADVSLHQSRLRMCGYVLQNLLSR